MLLYAPLPGPRSLRFGALNALALLVVFGASAAVLLLCFGACYSVSNSVKRYNLRYDESYNRSNALFFVILAFVSLVVGCFTW